MFWILTPFQIYDLQIFLPLVGLFFHFVDSFIVYTETLM